MTDYICTVCGALSNRMTKKVEGGFGCGLSFLVLLVIIVTAILGFINCLFWLVSVFFMILGFKGHGKEVNCCDKCQSTNTLIPIDTPKGQELYRQYYNEEEEEGEEE